MDTTMDTTENNAPESLPGHGRIDRREQIRQRQAELEAEARREINLLASDFHDRLPRAEAKGIGVIYARYSSRFQDSIGDQVRTCFETAIANELFVPLDHICFDLAVRGSKANRPGLTQANKWIEAGGVNCLIAFATNRLHRKMHRALRFVEEELVERGIRAIFPKSSVDTADTKSWKLILSVNAMMDEFVVSMYADNVRASHEGLMERGLVFGSLCFGYDGEPIHGEFTRLKRPRCRIIVDPATGPVVKRIFEWYADDRVTIDAIVRRLNDDPSIPLPPRSLTGAWSREVVHRLLNSSRYRGLWKYGITQGVWESKKDYSRKQLRNEPLRVMQVERLRIVSDELWARVQRRLESEPKPVGRKPKDENRRTRPLMLNGLFRCPVHDRPLYVCGPNGHMMFCKACKELPAEKRPLFSQLHRAAALRLTCQALAKLVRADESLVISIIAACHAEVGRAGQPDPTKAERLRKKIQQTDRQIKFLIENLGETEADRQESADNLRQLRRSRSTDQAELEGIQAAGVRTVVVPDETKVRAILDGLALVLERAAFDASEEEQGVAREIISSLTGGRIDLEQQGERQKHLGWLRGRFRVKLLSYLTNKVAGTDVMIEDEGHEIVINYREPTLPESLADQVKELFDQGLLVKEIGPKLGISRAIVAKAWAHWHESRGLPVPDGRSRRSSLARKHIEPPMYQKLADPAKVFYDEGHLNTEIARRLGCDINTVTSAIAHWFKSRDLEVPDGRTRRKSLSQKTVRPSPAP